MALIDRLFTRSRVLPRFSDLPDRTRRRLRRVCAELDAAEADMARRLELAQPPRLLLVDEEEAVVVDFSDRRDVPANHHRRSGQTRRDAHDGRSHA